ncbi:hypothetical protein F9L33_15225 [Amylibacter sp. SFDW26]|uniref:hypothetical protein n=1 Tax=Amylibacter sp. SFDW26 TaxID=2652722 RepID=UPI001261A21F|nr:hypothetical protein [Amylibacter sp. SFDW26]KAB7610057.1 hypothetical protein F9L33_15225 [Amylibacter sp. SFDW26]
MEVKVYVGGHRTNLEHFSSTLAANSDYMHSEKISYSPATRRTLKRISEAISSMKAGDDIEDIQQRLRGPLSIKPETKTLLIVDSRMIGAKNRPFGKTFYAPRVGTYYRDLKKLFEGHTVRLYAETRNPTSLTEVAYAESILSGNFNVFEAFLSGHDLNDFRWSKFIHRIQGKNNAIGTTIWRYEDYPYIWRDVIGAFTGLPNHQDLIDPPVSQGTGLSFQGAQLFTKYTKEYPDLDQESLLKVRKTFLRQFPNLNHEETISYWPAEQADTLTHSYEDDWYYIKRIDNTEIIEPISANEVNG